MKGVNKIIINQSTMRDALTFWLVNQFLSIGSDEFTVENVVYLQPDFEVTIKQRENKPEEEF